METTEVARSLILELVHKAIGCFSSCFTIRDADHHPRPQITHVLQSITQIPKEDDDDHLASNCVWSVLDTEVEGRGVSQFEDERYGVTGSLVLDEELRDEVNFLKSCGSLPQSHEIPKTDKCKGSQSHDEDSEPTTHSWLPKTATEKVFEKQPHLQSRVKLVEKGEHGLDSSKHSSTRPMLGVSSAYWNAYETPFLPKKGDGNGIPNTTHKYSEDQKVSWHATPFEERLEKALIEDKFISKRMESRIHVFDSCPKFRDVRDKVRR